MKEMRTPTLIMLLLGLLSVPARADYHSVLIGARLHLSTTTIEGRQEATASMDSNGITVMAATNRQQTAPGLILEGYIWRLNTDPSITISSASRPAELGERWVSFLQRDEIVRLKYPRPGLARTKTILGLYVPIAIITKVERLPGPFDGDAGMGEPFFVLPWQANLMSSKPPTHSCAPNTERNEVEWVSYNPAVGENELAALCAGGFDVSGAAPLVKKGNVFAIFYPAD